MFNTLLIFLFFGLLNAYEPTATKPWPTVKPRIKWPSSTLTWGEPPTEFPDDILPTADDNKFKFTPAVIAGIVVGSVVLVGIIVAITLLIIKKKKRCDAGTVLVDTKSIDAPMIAEGYKY